MGIYTDNLGAATIGDFFDRIIMNTAKTMSKMNTTIPPIKRGFL